MTHLEPKKTILDLYALKQWFSTYLSSQHTKREKKLEAHIYLNVFKKDIEKEHYFTNYTKSPYFPRIKSKGKKIGGTLVEKHCSKVLNFLPVMVQVAYSS